ncbi:hypothetical protein [Enterococcus raffinosus]|uniref:Uncharacterized protein n=1 Tax=Enterococcus raffinosus TaxID=71452 RepID=A0AAW8TA48_9ENTE|nr:hypothetical protein [Enterococcus raffinosus]MDT2521985.1 hypothetical protein [Enterococcus raffinosus]MDT2528330.1 hypothetical protein [Enterococcus raffinosus]MDT2533205.1 hypothetical protein [Enterococcus raffinosus]MDT2543645.1 hypothetical protein [Enterococcus raffinosus]MDT2553759.1 hypothetical protein [Enterococcus raffinosus]
MKKICFVLTVSTGLSYSSMFLPVNFSDNSDLKEYFSKDYDVSINYLMDKNSVDYLVVPDPYFPFDNENNLPIIKVPSRLFMTKDFEGIKTCIDNYFATILEE